MAESRERSPRASRKPDLPNWKQYRCYAIGLAYSGDGYHGFQVQPDIPTVEADIQAAVVASGLIDPVLLRESNRDKLFWSRAARTDRGVHACMNVVACRLDSEKVPVKVSDGAVQELDQGKFCDLLNAYLPDSIRCVFINRVTMRFDARAHCDSRSYEYYLPITIDGKMLEVMTLKQELEKYVGTRNFHNFTRGMTARDKTAVRHIVSISVEPVGQHHVCVKLLGQSFLLNQIRKIIGLAVEVTLGLAPENAIETALYSKRLVHIHMVPGEGLLLERLFFKGYDLHKCGDYTVTTPFSWLIADEESEGDAEVMWRISEFKNRIVHNVILPDLKDKFDHWARIFVLPNSWDARHDEETVMEPGDE